VLVFERVLMFMRCDQEISRANNKLLLLIRTTNLLITSHKHQYSFKYQHILLLYPTLIPPNQSWQLSHISHSLPFHYSTSLWTNQHISRKKCKMSHHSIFFPTNLCSHNQATLLLETSPTWNQKQKTEKPDQDHGSRFRINGVYLNDSLDLYTIMAGHANDTVLIFAYGSLH
jgi:hypothetical protein